MRCVGEKDKKLKRVRYMFVLADLLPNIVLSAFPLLFWNLLQNKNYLSNPILYACSATKRILVIEKELYLVIYMW